MHVNLFKDTTDWDELRKILGTQQQNSHWYTHEKIEWHTAEYDWNGHFKKGYQHRFFWTSQEICINVIVKACKEINLKIKVF